MLIRIFIGTTLKGLIFDPHPSSCDGKQRVEVEEEVVGEGVEEVVGEGVEEVVCGGGGNGLIEK